MDLSCFVSAGLSLILYLNTLSADFAYDDRSVDLSQVVIHAFALYVCRSAVRVSTWWWLESSHA